MDQHIIDFINLQTSLTLCTSNNEEPYCANCFYALDSISESLIIKSNSETRHIKEASLNNKVAGTILPDKFQIGKIKGIQFSGIFNSPSEQESKVCKEIYYGRYPFARAFAGDFWLIQLSNIKFTDNTLGFGKKLLWERMNSIVD